MHSLGAIKRRYDAIVPMTVTTAHAVLTAGAAQAADRRSNKRYLLPTAVTAQCQHRNRLAAKHAPLRPNQSCQAALQLRSIQKGCTPLADLLLQIIELRRGKEFAQRNVQTVTKLFDRHD